MHSANAFHSLSRWESIRLFARARREIRSGLQPSTLYQLLYDLQDQTVEIRLPLPSTNQIFVTVNPKVATELFDDDRFEKVPSKPFRRIGGDGLLTAWTSEPFWSIAHRIIAPQLAGVFLEHYQRSIQKIANTLADRIRYRELNSASISIIDLVSRSTFDFACEIILGEHSGSLFSDLPDPLQTLSERLIVDLMAEVSQPSFLSFLSVRRSRRLKDSIHRMQDIFRLIIRERQKKNHEADRADLLERMIHFPDPITSERLDENNILRNCMTLFSAVFETSRASVAWVIYHLSTHQDLQRQLISELDKKIGVTGEITPEVCTSIPLLERILNEAQRLTPSFQGVTRRAIGNQSLLNCIEVPSGSTFSILLWGLHNNPQYWPNASRFDPDRFLPERERFIEPGSYYPFGSGVRACIGQGLARLEISTIILTLLRDFRFNLVGEQQLAFNFASIATQPTSLKLHFAERQAQRSSTIALPTAGVGQCPIHQPTTNKSESEANRYQALIDGQHKITHWGKPNSFINTVITIGYGSEGGFTAELARNLGRSLNASGIKVTVACVDDLVDQMSTIERLIVAIPSYNGTPPSNGRKFFSLLNRKGPDYQQLKYSVIGVGDHNWTKTFHSVPKRIHEALAQRKAMEFAPALYLDVARDYQAILNHWIEDLKEELLGRGNAEIQSGIGKVGITVSPLKGSLPIASNSRTSYFQLLGSIELLGEPQRELGRSRLSLSLRLPPAISYKAGDYLQIIPSNDHQKVEYVLFRLGLDPRALIEVSSSDSFGHWIPPEPLTLYRLFSDYIDITSPLDAHRSTLIQAIITGNAPSRPGNTLPRTLIDLAKDVTPCESIDLGLLLTHLLPMQRQYYSIASCSGISPDVAEIISATSINDWSAPTPNLCTAYLNDLRPGDLIRGKIVDSAFHPPVDSQSPIVCISIGACIAPFKAFFERKAHKHDPRINGSVESLLLIASAGPGIENLLGEIRTKWRSSGVVDVHEGSLNGSNGAPPSVNELIEWLGAFKSQLIKACDNQSIFYLSSALPNAVDVLGGVIGQENLDMLHRSDRLHQELTMTRGMP